MVKHPAMQLRNTDLPYTRVHSEMRWRCDMDGTLLAWPQSVHVARAMTSNMPSAVRQAGCPSTDITTFRI